MNAVEIYKNAESDLEHNRITIGEFEERIEPLKDVVCVVRCPDCRYKKTCINTEQGIDTDGFCKWGKTEGR